jgi:hypothetical protein
LTLKARIRIVVVSIAAVLALTDALRSSVTAQSVSDSQVKAAYLYSFAKFVEWPARKFPEPSTPILFCLVSDPGFESELNRTVKGKAVSGRAVRIVLVEEVEQARNCHVLFFNAARSRQTQRILEGIRGAAVLTVGEADDFLQEGGMIRFVLNDDRVQFEVNHKAASQEGFYISARLLGVARKIFE